MKTAEKGGLGPVAGHDENNRRARDLLGKEHALPTFAWGACSISGISYCLGDLVFSLKRQDQAGNKDYDGRADQ